MELPSAVVDRVLEVWPVARLATMGPDGPHAVPIVFARAGGCIWSPVDGKPKRGGELARVAHLRADPRATLLIDRWDPDWTRLWWLRVDVEGEKAVIRGKVWKRDETEPEAWTITAEDPLPVRSGSPGLIGYAPSEIHYDNIKVTPNG